MSKHTHHQAELGVLLASLLLIAVPPAPAQELVADEPEPQLRLPVSHGHMASACYGYLYVTRKTLRYEVKWPDKEKKHSFDIARGSLTYVGQDYFMGDPFPASEFKFGGKTYNFYLIDAKVVEDPNAAAGSELGDWEVIVAAVRDFEATVTRLRPPPPPKPQTVSLQIQARPGGTEFYLDDQFKGTTSSEGRLVVADLAPGEHRLRLYKKDYEEWNRTLTLEAGENRTIDVQLMEAKPAEPPPPDTTLGLADVLKLLEGGVTPARIETIVKDRGVSFELTDDAESKLRALGATDSLLLAIAKAKK